MTVLMHNIDPIRERIMELESATVFDQRAWAEVLIALTDRPNARADAARRMETARQNAQWVGGVDRASGEDRTVARIVSAETDNKQRRVEQANQLIQIIASCGREFFSHNGRVSRFELDARGRVWFVDAYREARIYTHYTRGRWHGFSEGGTLRDLVIKLRQFIQYGYDIGFILGPYPAWYSGGDPWGYGADIRMVQEVAIRNGMAGRMAERIAQTKVTA